MLLWPVSETTIQRVHQCFWLWFWQLVHQCFWQSINKCLWQLISQCFRQLVHQCFWKLVHQCFWQCFGRLVHQQLMNNSSGNCFPSDFGNLYTNASGNSYGDRFPNFLLIDETMLLATGERMILIIDEAILQLRNCYCIHTRVILL